MLLILAVVLLWKMPMTACQHHHAQSLTPLKLAHGQVDGAVTSGPDLSVEVNGLRLPNPFVIGSGAPRNCLGSCFCASNVVRCQMVALCALPNTLVHLMLPAGPPGTNYAVMKKAFEEGWGAVIAKTVSLDSSKASTWC